MKKAFGGFVASEVRLEAAREVTSFLLSKGLALFVH
jgi:hypothetical protein